MLKKRRFRRLAAEVLAARDRYLSAVHCWMCADLEADLSGVAVPAEVLAEVDEAFAEWCAVAQRLPLVERGRLPGCVRSGFDPWRSDSEANAGRVR